MCERCGNPIYKKDQRRYFDWAKGIRATDENHAAAQRYFERMQELGARGPAGTRILAREGEAIAQEVREGICALIDGSGKAKPQNVILGNSTTLALMPALMAMGLHGGRRLAGIYNPMSYSPLLRNLCDIAIDSQMDESTLEDLIEESEGRSLPSRFFDLTRQNYGQDPDKARICRTMSNEEIAKRWKRHAMVAAIISEDERDESQGYFLRSFMTENELAPFMYCELVNGQNLYGADSVPARFNQALSPISGGKRTEPYAKVLDISHSFGTHPPLPYNEADLIIGASSKLLAAEPTVGFVYASDRVMGMVPGAIERIEKALGSMRFQFHPDTYPGRKARSPGKWISLPELASFASALASFRSLSAAGRVGELKRRRAEVDGAIERINTRLEGPGAFRLRISSLSGDYCDAFFPRKKKPEWVGSIPPHMLCLAIEGEERGGDHGLGAAEDMRRIGRSMRIMRMCALAMDDLESDLQAEGFWFDRKREGRFMDLDDMMMEFSSRDSIRISLQPQVDQDIEGFFGIVEKRLMRLKGMAEASGLLR